MSSTFAQKREKNFLSKVLHYNTLYKTKLEYNAQNFSALPGNLQEILEKNAFFLRFRFCLSRVSRMHCSRHTEINFC